MAHNGARWIERMNAAWPLTTLVYLPIHASWLKQVEISFSIVRRKVVKLQNLPDLAALVDRLLQFQDRANDTAISFDWRFGRTILRDLLNGVTAHEPVAAQVPTN